MHQIQISITTEEMESIKHKTNNSGFGKHVDQYLHKTFLSKHHVSASIDSDKPMNEQTLILTVSEDMHAWLCKSAKRLKLENDLNRLYRKLIFTKYFLSQKRISAGKSKRIGIRLSDQEHQHLLEKSEKMGLSLSDYFRKLIFEKDLILSNPDRVIQELYATRSELNKIGSNVNQIANYSNFLASKSYVEKEVLDDFKVQAIEVKMQLDLVRKHLDDTIRRV